MISSGVCVVADASCCYGYVQVEKLYVIKMGEMVLLKDGQEVHDPTWIKEAGGFTFFGDTSLDAISRSPYQVSLGVIRPLGFTAKVCHSRHLL